MNYKEFDLKVSYKSVGEETISTIINPLLSCTKIYKRSVGFFSSTALNFISEGIVDLSNNNGQILLATSPELSEEDINAIANGYEKKKIYEKAFVKEFEKALIDLNDTNFEILSKLIYNGTLEIKIVKKKNGGMYHDKLAVLTDFNDNVLVFQGSNNESENGYNSNYEKVRVYRSWFDFEGRIEDETMEFESIWNNSNDYLDVYEFNDAINQSIIKSREYKKREIFKFEPRDYQEEAKDNWIKNKCTGFFVMATGTGKTLTSLYSIKELIEQNKIFTIIAVPYKHLAHQWYEDVIKMFPNSKCIIVHGEMGNKETDIYSSYLVSKTNYIPIIIITTLQSFFLPRYQNVYKMIKYEKLLIVDEAHNFINHLTKDLNDQYKYKLGLSATPVFSNNIEKTKLLLNWFGGQVINYPIEKAIGKCLVNYEYCPIEVQATEEDEQKFNSYTQMMLSAFDSKTQTIINEDLFIAGYRGRLRTIAMATQKLEKINDIFAMLQEKDHTIIYCSDGKIFSDNKKDEEKNAEKHLDFILKLINDDPVNLANGVKASKFTANESANIRMLIIDRFNKGEYKYLTAIKCLDEGINIPSIKNAIILSSNDNYREFVQRRGRILREYTDPITKEEKKIARIYDFIVLPSIENKSFAKIEFRRYYEYANIAINKKKLFNELDTLIKEYDLTYDDIKFDNEFTYGGKLDE